MAGTVEIAGKEYELVDVDTLKPWVKNPRKNDKAVDKVISSIKKFGFVAPLIVRKSDRMIIAGHTRWKAAKKLGMTEVPVVWVEMSDNDAALYNIADNRLTEVAEWDFPMLLDIAEEFNFPPEELAITGFTYDDLTIPITADKYSEGKDGSLTERYIVPPFSVLDSRQGYWQERKKEWIKLIGFIGETREGALSESELMKTIGKGVSLFDPVLAEVLVSWFSLKGWKTFDTFAGDVSFGFVSAYLGRPFTGIELREEQVRVNQEKADEYGLPAKWITDDGANAAKHFKPESQDFFFSCPPYFNLEVYSDLPNDASNQDSYEDFISIIERAFTAAIKALKQDRFAAIVVSDVRDKRGFYLQFPADIMRIFRENGMELYNDMVLVNAVGTASIRAGGYFNHRKVARTHQQVLIFYKGDPKKIKSIYPPIPFEEVEEDGV